MTTQRSHNSVAERRNQKTKRGVSESRLLGGYRAERDLEGQRVSGSSRKEATAAW
ncbi:MAG: hypothetical protein KAQ81_07165 [Deltaproteobacteria bacterium]|nr:hypothetical protein [Deltaproteobacteria bacterium]